MLPYRGMLHTDRYSEGLSTRLDDPKTFTRQSYNTNNAPRDLFYGPVTWNPVWTHPESTSTSTSMFTPTVPRDVNIAVSTLSLHQYTAHFPVSYPA